MRTNIAYSKYAVAVAVLSIIALTMSARTALPPVFASTITSCGTSPDGGAWGFTQLTNSVTLEGAAIMKHYYGSSAKLNCWATTLSTLTGIR